MKNQESNFRRASWIRLMIALTVIFLSASGYLRASAWFIFKNDLGHYFTGCAMGWPGDLHAEIAIVPRNHRIGPITTKFGFVGINHHKISVLFNIRECGSKELKNLAASSEDSSIPLEFEFLLANFAASSGECARGDSSSDIHNKEQITQFLNV